jgi:hypothetical protein
MDLTYLSVVIRKSLPAYHTVYYTKTFLQLLIITRLYTIADIDYYFHGNNDKYDWFFTMVETGVCAANRSFFVLLQV